MERTSGRPEVRIGVIDGPVLARHPDLNGRSLREIRGTEAGVCTGGDDIACLHGTFVTGILAAKRSSPAPAICPDCTVLTRPIFSDATSSRQHLPSATPRELAGAIIECLDAGASIINLSLALEECSTAEDEALKMAISLAAKRRVIVVAAAGNHGTLGSSTITRHPWVIPVVACDFRGRPIRESNLGRSIGRRGLTAPGEAITSLGPKEPLTLGGTSVAVPFVTGAIALLLSEFPSLPATEILLAITGVSTVRRASVVPPLLDGAAAYRALRRS